MTRRKKTARAMLWYSKRDVKKRGLRWNLSDKRALELLEMPCHWCGTPANPFSGIDRGDNEPFYRYANTVAACWPCNRAKRDMTAKQWLQFCARIVAHRHAKAAPARRFLLLHRRSVVLLWRARTGSPCLGPPSCFIELVMEGRRLQSPQEAYSALNRLDRASGPTRLGELPHRTMSAFQGCICGPRCMQSPLRPQQPDPSP